MNISLARPEDLLRIVQIHNQAVPSQISTGDTEPLDSGAQEGWFRGFLPG